MRTGLSTLLALLALAGPAAVPAQEAPVYEWVDAEGRRHYTDDPNRVPEAQREGAQPGLAGPPPAPGPPTGPLCLPGVTAVSSRWDQALRRITERLLAAAGDELAGRAVRVLAVDGPDSLPASASCGDAAQATIVVPLRTLREIERWGDPEWAFARVLAHELAHRALHPGPSPADPAAAPLLEHEADERGLYYFERAGYDCQTWVNAIGVLVVAPHDTEANQRQALQAACALAREGQRPPRRDRSEAPPARSGVQ